METFQDAQDAKTTDHTSTYLAADRHGGLHPDQKQMQILLDMAERKVEGPFHFLNLLSFRDSALYPEGHEFAKLGLSGKEAYNSHYGPVAFEHVTKRGGRLTVLADVEFCVLGQGHQWHQAATMEYQSIEAFLDMGQDPDYQASLVHRDAGLTETIVLATRPLL